MTKKITITLEENLIDELGDLARESGKKKTQVVREALQDYMDINAVTKTVYNYKTGLLKTVSHEDVKASLGLCMIFNMIPKLLDSLKNLINTRLLKSSME